MAKPIHLPVMGQDGPMSTIDRQGHRRWIHPTTTRGRFWKARLGVAAFLVAAFVAIPHLRINGKPGIWLDLATRQFSFFGKTFFATDTILLPAFGVSLVLTVAVVTALFGRVWCGWACPQTVYLEFIYRPLDTLFEGSADVRARAERAAKTMGGLARKAAKWTTWLVISAILSLTFVSYFAGTEAVFDAFRNPAAHSTALIAAAVVTGAMLFDFGWFREQTCIIACPYGRLQSVLLDRASVIVGYDAKRGEPRTRPGKAKHKSANAGDCIDCLACIRTCPTGIDIRQGLQLECVGCTQCIDACDAIMDRMQRPRGLVRYTSLEQLEGKSTRLLRPRVLVYFGIAATAAVLLSLLLSSRKNFEFEIIRRTGAPFAVQSDGVVANRVRVRITNRTDKDQRFEVLIVEPTQAHLVTAELPLTLPPRAVQPVDALIQLPRDRFSNGRAATKLRVVSSSGESQEHEFVLLGPVGAP